MGFPGSSDGKESACNARDPSLIPGLGRSTGEGINYPLQYSWASLVAQLVENLLAMRETWVQCLGLGRSPGGIQYSGLENSVDCIVHGVAKSCTGLSNFHFHYKGIQWTLKEHNHISKIERQFLYNICLSLISYLIRVPLFSREIKGPMAHNITYIAPSTLWNSEKLSIHILLCLMKIFTSSYFNKTLS